MRAILNVAALRESLRRRFSADAAKMDRIGQRAIEQVRDRYTSGGQTGGVTWPQTTTPLGKRPPLDGLQNTWRVASTDKESTVASTDARTLWSHLGNVGKGGVNPDIVPVHAKALYIPLTELGRQQYEARRMVAPIIRTIHPGMSHVEMASQRFDSSTLLGVNPAKYGVDFIFAKRVSQPPRPQTPTSDSERWVLGEFAIKVLKD